MGAGDNQPDVVFMTLGTGVGGGIVAEGKLLHGQPHLVNPFQYL